MIDLDELERLEREATAGPWHREYLELQRGGMMTLGIGAKDRPVCIVNGIVESPPGLRDVAFIVTLRNALPDLLREVRELRAMKAELEALAALARVVAPSTEPNFIAGASVESAAGGEGGK